MAGHPSPTYLIVNADDYGYFRCVSRGIVEAASRGIVTATGVIANRDGLEDAAAALADCPALDAGVHLNLTTGVPLTAAMREKCARWQGRFPGKFAAVGAVLAGAIKADDVSGEWQAQIERCLAAGVHPVFLNSHEHVHMLPSLFDVAGRLAERYGIRHLRFTTAELGATPSAGAVLRAAIMGTLQRLCAHRASAATPRFLGLGPSGKLSLAYFRRVLPRLAPGVVYELMCHPGRLNRTEVEDAALLAYHDWEGELATLTDPALPSLLGTHGVAVVGYRDLQVVDGRLSAAARSAMPAVAAGGRL